MTAAKAVKVPSPEKIIVELAKKGESASKIGIILRDQYGIGSVKEATGKEMSRLLKENELGGEVPEDLRNLLKRRAMLIKHNAANHGDMCGKRGQQIVEAKIRGLSKYYQDRGVLPKGWKYKKAGAAR